MKTFLFIPILIFITKTDIIEAVKNEETVSKVQAPTLVKAFNNTSEQGVHFKTFILKNKGEFAKIPAVDYDELNVFCYEGVPAAVSLFWSSSGLKLDLSNNNYEVYIGNNISSVVTLLKARESEWIYSSLPWRSKEFKLSPFENACVGIQTTESYSISLQWKHVNYGAVLVTVLGLSMFMMAPKLCRNTFFHYTTGISFGLLLSTFIITYFIQRKIKQSFLSWFGLAYSLSVYMITKTWFNMKEWLTEQYFHYVVGYILVVSLVSFGFIYRVGLPSDNRTLNLIQWTMQLVASIMVLFSSYHTAASLSVMMSVITWYNIPAWLKYNAHTQIRKRLFKPKVSSNPSAKQKQYMDDQFFGFQIFCWLNRNMILTPFQ